MASIYLADDEKEIRDVIRVFLENDGHTVITFGTGDELLEAFRHKPCDLILLDIMMPGSDGISILATLRNISKVPVILITAKNSDGDLLSGLALGSDDYIAKPFNPMILSAKVNALLRRIQFEKANAPTINAELAYGNLRYSAKRHEMSVGGQTVCMTPTEMRFLLYMMERPGDAVSREELLGAIWGVDCELETRVADETSRRIRKKLVHAEADVVIQTIWGYGFRLVRKGEQL